MLLILTIQDWAALWIQSIPHRQWVLMHKAQLIENPGLLLIIPGSSGQDGMDQGLEKAQLMEGPGWPRIEKETRWLIRYNIYTKGEPITKRVDIIHPRLATLVQEEEVSIKIFY